MTGTDQIITLFNARVDKEKRREVFIPTNIIGVSFYEIDLSRSTGMTRNEEITCKIRIPLTASIEGRRTYLPEDRYKALTDEEALFYWTLQKDSYVLIASAAATAWGKGAYDIGHAVTKKEMTALCSEPRYTGRLINIVEYADNTRRGTRAVRHWRIGGR